MLRLNERQRTLLTEKVCDLANLAAAALVFGQFLGDRFSIALAVVGIVTWLALAGFAVTLARERAR